MLIFLTGFMGVGKTTMGKSLAENLNYTFVDLDLEIEKDASRTISDIFKEEGEPYFRNLERSILLKIIKSKPSKIVIALGGGTICNLNNHVNILQNGISVYLKKDWNCIWSNIKKLSNRPLLVAKSERELKQLFEKREQFYAFSQLTTPINTAIDVKKLTIYLKLLTNR